MKDDFFYITKENKINREGSRKSTEQVILVVLYIYYVNKTILLGSNTERFYVYKRRVIERQELFYIKSKGL